MSLFSVCGTRSGEAAQWPSRPGARALALDPEAARRAAQAVLERGGPVAQEGLHAVAVAAAGEVLAVAVVHASRSRGSRSLRRFPARAVTRAAQLVAESLAVLDRAQAAEAIVARYERWFVTQDRHIRVLDRERQKFATLVNQSRTYCYVTDLACRITWTNKTLADSTPAEGESWIGASCRTACAALAGGAAFACHQCPVETTSATGEMARQELRRDSPNDMRTLYVTAVPVKDPDGSSSETLVMVQDLTDLEVLRESEARKGAMLESALDAVITIDATGRIAEFNPAAEHIFGYRREDVIGRVMSDILVPEGEREAHRMGLQHCVGTGESHLLGRRVEVQGQRADGTLLPLELTIARLPSAGAPMFTGFLRDLTEQKRLESQLRHAQKMDAVGRLAGGVAHDFNNLLTVIMGHSELLSLRLDAEDPHRIHALEIHKAGRRGGWLTRQLLAFSRNDIAAPTRLDLAAITGEMERMLRRLIGEDIELETRVEGAAGLVLADQGQLEQVIMNLAVNARDAMPHGGRLSLEITRQFVSGVPARLALPAGSYVVLTVRDTGCGMNADTVQHVFEPFYTTKEHGKGTGLGLSIAYGIVQAAGGAIVVDSAPGQGTAVHVYLPHVDAAPSPSDAVPAGTETILLVEDEAGVRALTEEILSASGYHVLVAASAADGLAVAARCDGAIDLVLSDVVMPGMGGGEMAARLVAARPELRVLFMSGYTDDAVIRHGVRAEGTPFLQKPFTVESLLRKVRDVLDGGRASLAAPDPTSSERDARQAA